MPNIELDDHPTGTDIQILEDGVTRYGRSLSQGDARPLACWIRQDGQLRGGVCGRTELGRLFIQYLWVDEAQRGQGWASDLLTQIEAAARERGCRDALIETLLDPVAELYQRRGYQVLACIPDWVGRFSRTILCKPLQD